MKKDKLDRRDFIVGTTTAALAAGAGLGACSDDNSGQPDSGQDQGPGKEAGSDLYLPLDFNLPPVATGRVVELHDAKAISGKTPDAARVKAMLKPGMQELTGQQDMELAWRAILPEVTPATRIGLKLNCLSSYLYNSATTVGAVVESLANDLGADPAKIYIWDRRGDEVDCSQLAGKVMGANTVGTVKSITDKSGPGYEGTAEAIKDRKTHLAKLLTTDTDLTINMPLLKRHNVSGITCAMKNTYGVIDNPGDFHSGFAEYMPQIYALPKVHKRFRLHICEALMSVIKGDTADPVDTISARMLLSVDPVAMDTHAVALIDELRSPLPGISAHADLSWLDKAEGLKLGTTKVDLKKVVI